MGVLGSGRGGTWLCGAFFALVPVLLLAQAAAAAQVDAPAGHHFTLVTLGPGADLFELWGHSVLCVSQGTFEDGMCYDYGWSRVTDPAALAVGTLRGEALFVPKKWPARAVLRAYQFRDFWKQKLIFDEGVQRSLLARLEADVAGRRGYCYEPVLENCTTRLRDAMNRELGGGLDAERQGRPGPPLRTFAEQALRGRVVPLVLLELGGGARLDAPTSEWQRMAFPKGLLESVHGHLGAKPERVFSRRDQPPETSRHAGRLALLVLVLVSSALTWRMSSASPLKRSVVVRSLGVWLGFLSLIPILGAMSALPSLSGNWLLAVLVPTDLLLLLGVRGFLPKYLLVRVALTSFVLALSLTGLIPQALWAPSLLVLMPFGALLIQFQRRRT